MEADVPRKTATEKLGVSVLAGGSGFPELENELQKIMNEDFLTFCVKQRDYGPGNISKFGEHGVLVRVSDKVERLINLTKHGRTPSNEAIEDTWKDIRIYAAIAEMIRRGKWPGCEPANPQAQTKIAPMH